MTKQHENRVALELSDGYWADALDYIQRYKLTVTSEVRDYWSPKSRRMKAYLDLRFAIEAYLKSRICLSTRAGSSREELLKELRGLSHNIGRLVQRSGLVLDSNLVEALKKCDEAPVYWRYEVEARASRAEDDSDYRSTVGNDVWMKMLEDFVASEVTMLGRELNAYGRLVVAVDLIEENH